MYGTPGVIHVWYIRCDSAGVIEMPPPPASRQASSAVRQHGARASYRPGAYITGGNHPRFGLVYNSKASARCCPRWMPKCNKSYWRTQQSTGP